MDIIAHYVDELDREVKRSRRALEQVPEGKRGWKPHERSMDRPTTSASIDPVPMDGADRRHHR